jgi:hypothetical protein
MKVSESKQSQQPRQIGREKKTCKLQMRKTKPEIKGRLRSPNLAGNAKYETASILFCCKVKMLLRKYQRNNWKNFFPDVFNTIFFSIYEM